MSETDNVHQAAQSAPQVLEAATRLVATFDEGSVDDYFVCFHPEAMFAFYTTDRGLESTAEWREL